MKIDVFYPQNFVVGGVQGLLFHCGFPLTQLCLVREKVALDIAVK